MFDPIQVYFHGVCGPLNPGGHGGWAFVVKADDKSLGQETGILEPVPHQTEMTVEYFALLQALEWLFKRKMQSENVRFFGSKRNLINQLTGVWDIDPALAESFAVVRNKLRKFTDAGFNVITKRQNQEVIDLARGCLQELGILSTRPHP